MESEPSSELPEIVLVWNRVREGQEVVLSGAQVRRWMATTDVEAAGALYHLLFGSVRTRPLVDPALGKEGYEEFLKRYYARCIRDDPRGEWADSRYTAAWDLVGWMRSMWERSPDEFSRWKAWLAEMYRTGDVQVRDCLVNGTLEHLFESRTMARAFADWKRDPVLAAAYAAAMAWPQGGGSSPLGAVAKRRRRRRGDE